jgi:dihydroxyacetone kinase
LKIVEEESKDISGTDSPLTAGFRAQVKALADKVISKEADLTKFDADVGDGDLGIGAARACSMVLKELNNLNFENDLKGAVLRLGDVFSDGFGGSSGPLWGGFISAAASALPAKLVDAT